MSVVDTRRDLAALQAAVTVYPNVFVTVNAVSIAAEATLWTPTSGKKFRLMGGLLTSTGAAGNIIVKDGSGGSTIFLIPNTLVGTPFLFNLPGNGLLSATANNLLRAIGVASQVLNGTLWGREE